MRTGVSNDDQTIAGEVEPIMLELGKALHLSQAFEGTLVLLLSLISHEDANADDGAFVDAAFDSYSAETLGQPLKRLGERVELPHKVTRRYASGGTVETPACIGSPMNISRCSRVRRAESRC